MTPSAVIKTQSMTAMYWVNYLSYQSFWHHFWIYFHKQIEFLDGFKRDGNMYTGPVAFHCLVGHNFTGLGLRVSVYIGLLLSIKREGCIPTDLFSHGTRPVWIPFIVHGQWRRQEFVMGRVFGKVLQILATRL